MYTYKVTTSNSRILTFFNDAAMASQLGELRKFLEGTSQANGFAVPDDETAIRNSKTFEDHGITDERMRLADIYRLSFAFQHRVPRSITADQEDGTFIVELGDSLYGDWMGNIRRMKNASDYPDETSSLDRFECIGTP